MKRKCCTEEGNEADPKIVYLRNDHRDWHPLSIYKRRVTPRSLAGPGGYTHRKNRRVHRLFCVKLTCQLHLFIALGRLPAGSHGGLRVR